MKTFEVFVISARNFLSLSFRKPSSEEKEKSKRERFYGEEKEEIYKEENIKKMDVNMPLFMFGFKDNFNNRKLEGFVIKLHEKDNDMPLKDIIELKDSEPVLNMELLKLGEYISKKTMSTLCSAYQTMLPSSLKVKTKERDYSKYLLYVELNKNYLDKKWHQLF